MNGQVALDESIQWTNASFGRAASRILRMVHIDPIGDLPINLSDIAAAALIEG
jgi:hypothetical protein